MNDLAGKRPNAMFCSRRCQHAAAAAKKRERRYAARRADTCKLCGASMEGKRPQSLFCSDAHAQEWRNRETAARLSESKAGRRCRGGCGRLVPVDRRANAEFCSDECKLTARRHERYGLTRDELSLLLAQQERCAICRGDWGVKGPQVDHDHASGAVRGILCTNCNTSLGGFADNPAILRAAADYVEGR
jgi:predicted nucleic acid-binding Zn ribbon protein